jgi:hypothetical protein
MEMTTTTPRQHQRSFYARNGRLFICPECRDPFRAAYTSAVFCGVACRMRAYRRRRRDRAASIAAAA